jgi:hypothetical protein
MSSEVLKARSAAEDAAETTCLPRNTASDTCRFSNMLVGMIASSMQNRLCLFDRSGRGSEATRPRSGEILRGQIHLLLESSCLQFLPKAAYQKGNLVGGVSLGAIPIKSHTRKLKLRHIIPPQRFFGFEFRVRSSIGCFGASI